MRAGRTPRRPVAWTSVARRRAGPPRRVVQLAQSARARPRRSRHTPALRLPCERNNERNPNMTVGTILLIVLVLLLVGAIPAWPYSRAWGYGPSSILGIVVLILLVLALTGRL